MASSGLVDLQSSTQLQNWDLLKAQWGGVGVAMELKRMRLSHLPRRIAVCERTLSNLVLISACNELFMDCTSGFLRAQSPLLPPQQLSVQLRAFLFKCLLIKALSVHIY